MEDDHACAVRPRFLEPDGIGEYRMTIFRHESGWTRSDVALRQRCYAVADVTRALAAEGFANVRVLDAVRALGLEGQVGRGFSLCAA